MADNIEKVYTPTVIDDVPFPQDVPEDLNATVPSTGTAGDKTYGATAIKNQPFPTQRIAVELLSSALNTRSKRIIQEFQFTQSGALQIGDYKSGVTGDIRISPDGIVARDSTGATTFALDATSGDAIFAGTIQAGSLIAGAVNVGNNNVIIDGTNRNIIVNDGTYDRVLIGYQAGGF